MAAKYNETKVYPLLAQQIINALHSPQFCQSLKLQVTGGNAIPNGAVIRLQHGMGFLSFGEHICVTVEAVSPSATKVFVSSECEMPTQMVDWGQNKKNVRAIFSYLEKNNLSPAPAVQNIGAAADRICPNCSNQVEAEANFCPNCGCML